MALLPPLDPTAWPALFGLGVGLTLLLGFGLVTWFGVPHGIGSSWRECDTQSIARNFLLDGFDPLVMKQAILRRLDTPRGSLPDDPSYGISLRSMLNAGADPERIASFGGIIRNEVCKDDRVASAVAVVTPSASFDAFRVALTVNPADPSLGGFSMTLAVTSAGVVLEAIS